MQTSKKKKLTRLEKTKQAHPDNFGPRYYKHDEFTTKKRLIIDFCKDYILQTCLVECIPYFESKIGYNLDLPRVSR